MTGQIDVDGLGDLQRIFLAGGGHQIGADRTRHAADHHPFAQPVAQRGHDPDEVLVARKEEEGPDIGPGQGRVDDVDDKIEIRARVSIFSRPL